MKQNDKLHIPVSSELKQKLDEKAKSLGLTLSAYSKLVLSSSLKGTLKIINQD